MAAVWELKVRPLGPIGAEVQGVDLARVSGTQIEAIKRVWHRHDVLVFRNQQLTDDHLLPSHGISGARFTTQPGRWAQVTRRLSRGVHRLQRARRQRRADWRAGRRGGSLAHRHELRVAPAGCVDALSESERLLDELWSYVEAAVYRHRWAVGDLVLWDNRTTMHRRDAFDPKARRVMHRTQIKGSTAPRRAADG